MEGQILIRSKEKTKTTLLDSMREACKKVAPVWPLESFTAVNPYLGLTGCHFDVAARKLNRVAGVQMTLPVSFYLNKIREGKITYVDLQSAISKKMQSPMDVQTFISELEHTQPLPSGNQGIVTLIDVATNCTGQDWNRFVTARISTWAASYFDKSQASWKAADQLLGIFESWRAEAQVDLSTEIAGLNYFRKNVKALPDQPLTAAKMAIAYLDIPDDGLPDYLHRLLLRVGGWSAHVARLDWDNELYGKKSGLLIEWLAVLICWEACMLKSLHDPEIELLWTAAKRDLEVASKRKGQDAQLEKKLVLQEAFDLSVQREIAGKFQAVKTDPIAPPRRPLAQAIFCIDVRSETFRRNLEQVNSGIDTIGFAGFFAFPIDFLPIAHSISEPQCPVLITPAPKVHEEIADKKLHQAAFKGRVLRHQVSQIWKSFKSGAVSCFGFVSPMGLSYLPKLLTDSFGLTRPVPHPDTAGIGAKVAKQKSVSLKFVNHQDVNIGIPLPQRTQMAKNALKAMSLTENFGRFVLVVGHGSTTVNNPHATGLDCGACGGRSGEPNAKVAAAVLNDKEVRRQLREENITIPSDTLFLACLHDTTTDKIRIFNQDGLPETMKKEFQELKEALEKAGKATRAERALRMGIKGNLDKEIIARSKDWSQVRPEWGLAGCNAFVVAPRERTKKLNFGGQTFLHSYEWKKDEDFSILELIMTAPMVVTSWINLQYYGSTVDNTHFGSGNKTLHNVTSGLGVMEGYSGDLRVGLPLQSVHDGENYQHEPARLNVIIDAPIDAMNAILEKHQAVKDLCDNEWIYLFALDEQGKVGHRYEGKLEWELVSCEM
ncbi:hypothetical protein SAMN04488057_102431 [Cyclobacterium lianum]|uniref:Probable inorganic carbon transporter subunit DabA n=1 Tax=Cyclobacterium lianum TaxID=388280 RepID=A0A1M7KFF8_9BACT|nr:DUF2309 domain-containing protein [Cyclobacterium lianum]SHM64046.1 hypothetical protein SAMN04488057_102431 [Cyclobacterium lianum]